MIRPNTNSGIISPFKGVIFDLDGTLIDSAPDINEIANSALRSIGASPISLPSLSV